ncbi:hypothetical protein Tchl_1438 [Thauera chlorobenzoica]|uniref:Uncharacterized protein n=1 Tax=Thauera chlorobenzoica TaxID=96773 RepID=A0A1L6FBJ4_9RHOO|nr:hypothetical protein Tchl_1438 [Thauera chlorobenzoica]
MGSCRGGRGVVGRNHFEHGGRSAHHRGEVRGCIDDFVAGIAVQAEREQGQRDEGEAQVQRQRDRTEAVHQRAGDEGAEGSADSVQEQDAGVAGKDFILVEVVDEVGDDDRVNRESHAAEQEQPGQWNVLDVPEGGDREPRQHGADGGDAERQAAVAGIGQAPHRPLQQGAADDCAGHQRGDPGGVEADALAIDRGQAPERAHRQPGRQRTDQGGRCGTPDQAQVQAWAGADLRLRKACHRHRQQRCADEDRRHREQRECSRTAQAQQLLGTGERGEIDHHVDGEHLAAALGCGLVVEPAFDHRVETDQADPGDDPQHHPEYGFDDQRMEQDAARDRRAEEGEGADVAHAPDQLRRDEGAEKEAEEVGGADQAQRGVGKPFQASAQGDGGAEQAGAEQQQGDAGEQGADGEDHGQHGRGASCPPRVRGVGSVSKSFCANSLSLVPAGSGAAARRPRWGRQARQRGGKCHGGRGRFFLGGRLCPAL